ncbi:hypothetical protein [Rhodococcus ruber]|uniref:hypothetical protein n=1 Tax=Rhodococcus ruber TaxID=1830 RepID=UPI003D81A681
MILDHDVVGSGLIWGALSLIGVATTFFGLRDPRAAFYIFALCLFGNAFQISLGPANFRVELYASALLALSLAMNRRAVFVPNQRTSAERVCFAAAFAWILLSIGVSIFVAPAPIRSLFMTFNLAMGILAYLVLARVRAEIKIQFVQILVIVLGVISTLSVCSLVLGLDNMLVAPPQGGNVERVRGIALEPNIMGQMCIMVILLSLHYIRRLSGALMAWLIPIGVAAILTNTRAVWICMIVAFVLFAVSRLRKVSIIPPLLATFGVFIWVAYETLRASWLPEKNSFAWKILNLTNSEEGTGSYRVRTSELASVDIDNENGWLWGLGVSSYQQRHPVDLTGATEGYLPNFWFGLVYDTGIVGLLAACAFFVAILTRTRLTLWASCFFGAVAFCAIFTNPFWMMFPLVLAGLAEIKQVSSSGNCASWHINQAPVGFACRKVEVSI